MGNVTFIDIFGGLAIAVVGAFAFLGLQRWSKNKQHKTAWSSDMSQANSEQVKQVQHRRKVYFKAAIIFMPVWILPPILMQSFADNATIRFVQQGWTVCGWLFGCVVLILASQFYYRCPVCKHPFSKYSGGKFCVHCKTRYDA